MLNKIHEGIKKLKEQFNRMLTENERFNKRKYKFTMH